MNISMKTFAGVIVSAAALVALGQGPLAPPAAPSPTMVTLDQLYNQADDLHDRAAALADPRFVSSTTTVLQAGYYAGVDLADVEPALRPEHIAEGVSVFGITGTHPDGPLETGLFRTYAGANPPAWWLIPSLPEEGQDSTLRRGLPWPDPRFEENGDVVIDNLTGLMWPRNAYMQGGGWSQNVDWCNNLDFAGYDDWRMPNINEWLTVLSESDFWTVVITNYNEMRPDYRWYTSMATGTNEAPLEDYVISVGNLFQAEHPIVVRDLYSWDIYWTIPVRGGTD